METLGAASLAKEIPAQRAVAAVVPREEITTVLKDPEASAELFLRITGGGLDESDEPVIAMTWSREDLERLLDQASGDNVVLTFDREQLAQAIGDVEAHGLREKALVFAVVATGALGSGAAIANAMPQGDEGGPVVTQVAPSADVRVTDASSGAGYTAPAAIASSDDIVSDAALGAGYGVQAADASGTTMTDVSSAGGYTTPASPSDSIVSDAASGAGYTAPASPSDSIVSDAASGAGYAAAEESSAADTLRTDASSAGGYGTVADTGGSVQAVSGHESDTTDALVAGGILLAIAGATFAARRSGPTARPA